MLFVKYIFIILLSFLRYAKHYLEDRIEKRTLFKVYGIRIDIIVHSLVGKVMHYHCTFSTIYFLH